MEDIFVIIGPYQYDDLIKTLSPRERWKEFTHRARYEKWSGRKINAYPIDSYQGSLKGLTFYES